MKNHVKDHAERSDQRTSMSAPETDLIGYQDVLETVLGAPFTSGNRVRILRNGDEFFPPMLEAISNARDTVSMLTFIYWKGDIARRFADALAERAEAGVKVRLILDAVGSAIMPRELLHRMQAAGVETVWFRPPVRWNIWQADNRTHRKVLICDGRVAFTGGAGIAEEWEGNARGPTEWRDTQFQVEGPAVRGLQAAFIDSWVEAERVILDDLTRIQSAGTADGCLVQVVKTTAAAAHWSTIATIVRVLLTLARRKVRITTAYFVPTPSMVRLLQETAQRGIDVQVLVPGPHHDHPLVRVAQEHEYAPLIEAGVKLWAYQPTMLHTKIITVDDTVACVGSANFDHRSMSKDDELVLVILNQTVLRVLDQYFETDRESALAMDPGEYRRRGPLRTAAARVISLFRHQM